MKRGESGISLLVGVDKPAGQSSHDVVNRCRRIFGEKRVGHAGTLDPLATGALVILVGSATRLSNYFTENNKCYTVDIAFGAATDTDDADGTITKTAPVSPDIFDDNFVQNFLQSLLGKHMQLPPVYSAIKVGGTKSYEAARKGKIIDLKPREIEVYEAKLEGIYNKDVSQKKLQETLEQAPEKAAADTPKEILTAPIWRVNFSVSKGTYIRSLARDIGKRLNTCAHVSSLRRTQAGNLKLEDCISLESLEKLGQSASLDPVRLLGFRVAFLTDTQQRAVINGSKLLANSVELYEYCHTSSAQNTCSCVPSINRSDVSPQNGELVCLVSNNKLLALYEYDAQALNFKARCVLSGGVERGGHI